MSNSQLWHDLSLATEGIRRVKQQWEISVFFPLFLCILVEILESSSSSNLKQFFQIFILKVGLQKEERQGKRDLPSTGLLSKWSSCLELNSSEARSSSGSLVQVQGPKALRPSFAAFPGIKHGAGSER